MNLQLSATAFLNVNEISYFTALQYIYIYIHPPKFNLKMDLKAETCS